MRSRRLSFESLEDRRVMAVITVMNLNDAVVNTPAAIGTLRQAIFDANATPGVPDVIQFNVGLSGTIQLTNVGGQVEGSSALVVSSAITIRGNANGITIARAAAAPEMRLFRVTTAGNLTLESLNLTGGVARGDAGLAGADGGDGRGGAVFNEGTLQIVASTIYNNVAIGGAPGAGGNTGRGLGGGVYNDDSVLNIRNATFSGNQALNSFENTVSNAFGGGIYALNGALTIHNSTISANSALTGRGLYFVAVGEIANAEIHSTIIGQSDTDVFDLFASYDAGGTVNVTGADNLIRRQNEFDGIAVSIVDPELNALSSYGGPTLTHSLQPGSPAIDQGSNLLDFLTDQRGGAFARKVGADVDIGSFEASVSVPTLPGDYNRDAFVNAADYVLWRKLLGASVGQYALADGNGSGDVDPLDYGVWQENFGETTPESPPASGGGTGMAVFAPIALRFDSAVNNSELCRHKSETPAIDMRPIDDESHDMALLALLTAWDHAERGGRELIPFE